MLESFILLVSSDGGVVVAAKKYVGFGSLLMRARREVEIRSTYALCVCGDHSVACGTNGTYVKGLNIFARAGFCAYKRSRILVGGNSIFLLTANEKKNQLSAV